MLTFIDGLPLKAGPLSRVSTVVVHKGVDINAAYRQYFVTRVFLFFSFYFRFCLSFGFEKRWRRIFGVNRRFGDRRPRRHFGIRMEVQKIREQ